MNIDLNPKDALFNYIDSLLFDKDNIKSNSSDKSIEDTHSIRNVDELKNISQSEKNDLDILLFHSAGIPLAISATEISDIIEIELPFLKTLDTNNEIPLRIFDYRGGNILILTTVKHIFFCSRKKHLVCCATMWVNVLP